MSSGRGYHRLAVTRVVEETADARSYVLDVPDDLRETFRYRAGQFCTFRVRVGDEELLRCYSMSSAPETDDELAVTVKRVPGGRVSTWFHDEVQAGDVLELTRPAGVFGVTDADRPVLAFCGGSGVTPVLSVVKSVLATTARPVRMLYANRDRPSVIFDDALGELQAKHGDRLDVRHHLDVDGGYLDAAAVAGFVGGDVDADVLLCGPTPFMDLVEGTLLDLGVDSGRIAVERFADVVEHVEPAPDELEAVPSSVTIVFKGKRHEIAYQPGDTLLQTARRGGIPAPFSCEAGNCATCMAMLHDGSVTMRANTALTDEEVDEGWVLTCQSVPHGAVVTVEYEAM